MSKKPIIVGDFKYPVIEEKDYIFGAARRAPFEVLNPSGDWSEVLTTGEEQFNDRGDSIFQTCSLDECKYSRRKRGGCCDSNSSYGRRNYFKCRSYSHRSKQSHRSNAHFRR